MHHAHAARLALVLVTTLVIVGCGGSGKRAVNDPCANDSDCADNICHDGICASSQPLSNGAACAGSGQCRSFNCTAGLCAAGTAADGAVCLYNEECLSLLCSGHACVPAVPDGGVTDAAPAIDAGEPADAPAADAGAPTCASFAASYCGYLSACQPGTLQSDYGTLAGCTTARTAECATNLAAPGSGVTLALMAACAASLATQTGACSAGPVVGPIETPIDPCAVIGTGAAGAPCAMGAQCATDSCSHIGRLCGTCTAPGQLGMGCGYATGVTCPRGMTCSGTTSTCVTTVGVGSTCDLGVTTACVAGANCVVAASGDLTGTCQAAGAAVGTPCNSNAVGTPGCWNAAGVFCDNTSHCAAITYAAPSAACGEPGSHASDAVCSMGTCVSGSCVGDSPADGLCTAGGAPACAQGTVCVVSADGGAAGGAPGTCTTLASSCTTATPALAFTFQPSNVSLDTIEAAAGQAADEVVAADCSVTTDASAPYSDCFTSPITVVTQPGGTTVNLVVARSLEVAAGTTVTVTGGVPLVVVSLADIVWAGQLAANSSSSSLSVGPGGAAGADSDARGLGTGGGLAAAGPTRVGGGGGSFCGAGGFGGGATGDSAAYGATDLRPLVGGSAGGGGVAGSGAGGGAVQLVAAGAIELKAGGTITVGGAAGADCGVAAFQNSGGGGSGGAILLEAETVSFNGTLAANGGGGGGDYNSTAGDATADATAAPGGVAGSSGAAGGAGGAGATINGTAGGHNANLNAGAGGGGVGRIRVNTASGTSSGTGVYSPGMSTTCTTHGTIRALGAGA
jgi:hypothetical protein